MQQYEIVEIKLNQKGNLYWATIKSSTGVHEGDVKIWATDLPTPQVGGMVTGTIETSMYEGKLQKTLRIPKPAKTQMGVNMKKVMEQKQENIKEAQENKEYSIRIASSASGATAILTALIGKRGEAPDEVEWKKEWLEIRKWLFERWTSVDDTTPF